MKLGTANVKNFPDMDPGKVAADTRTIMEHTSVAGLQEIQPGEDTPVVRQQLAPHWRIVGDNYETPIVWDSREWRLQASHSVAFHRPRLPRPQNPHGAVTSATFSSVERPHLRPFAVLNAHLVAGGYNGPRILTIQDRWRTEWGIYQDMALHLWHQGLTVFAVGDLNNAHPPKLRPHGAFAWLSPMKGPDHLGQLEHESSVVMGMPEHQAVPLNSDHALHTLSGPLRRADT